MTMSTGGFELIHHSDYSIAMNLAKKFIGKNDNRMILKFVHHSKDGSIVATDSHRAFTVKNIHGYKEDTLLNPNSLEVAKGNYPDLSRVNQPRDNAKVIIKLGKEALAKWLQMHRSMNQMNKTLKNHHGVISMTVEKDVVRFEIKPHDIIFKLPFDEAEHIKDTETIRYRCEYMRDALEAHVSLNSKEVELQVYGSMSPFVLDDLERVQTIVLPARTY
jgi:hypothetical protein